MRPTASDRLLARLVTGPIGHLAAGAVDWVVLFARWRWARLRGRPLG